MKFLFALLVSFGIPSPAQAYILADYSCRCESLKVEVPYKLDDASFFSNLGKADSSAEAAELCISDLFDAVEDTSDDVLRKMRAAWETHGDVYYSIPGELISAGSVQFNMSSVKENFLKNKMEADGSKLRNFSLKMNSGEDAAARITTVNSGQSIQCSMNSLEIEKTRNISNLCTELKCE